MQDLSAKPLRVELADGVLVSVCVLSPQLSVFKLQSDLREAVMPLLAEHPQQLGIALLAADHHEAWIKQAAYVTVLNAHQLPQLKKASPPPCLQKIALWGAQQEDWLAEVEALAAANTVCRALTMTPPNMLTPALYQQCLQSMAAEKGWQMEVWTLEQLKTMGAGAFVAVAQGSESDDAAIIRLRYRPDLSQHAESGPAASIKSLALVGKGICFDTGGHNLKSSKSMLGMHQDMNGSAVAVAVLQAISALSLPVHVDCWLAVAQNHLGPHAYKQNDVVTALNGKTIEIVHTDAEGRMVLADTLTLASREQPDFLIDYATLTGSMQTALGSRMSGIVTNHPAFAQQMVAAGDQAGERVVVFPYAEDYDSALESEIADIKQCTLDSEADHILAARFLGQFIAGDCAWCHIDLSAYANKGGLGAVASEVTGFGVALTVKWLQNRLFNAASL